MVWRQQHPKRPGGEAEGGRPDDAEIFIRSGEDGQNVA